MPAYMADGGWRGLAACAGTDDELWFPGADDVVPVAAQVICAGCPVQAECLASALDTGEAYGVWGGLSASERRQIRPALAIAGRVDGEVA
jgi:hypothetical protein